MDHNYNSADKVQSRSRFTKMKQSTNEVDLFKIVLTKLSPNRDCEKTTRTTH